MDTYSRIGSVTASAGCEFLGVALPNTIVDQLPNRADLGLNQRVKEIIKEHQPEPLEEGTKARLQEILARAA